VVRAGRTALFLGNGEKRQAASAESKKRALEAANAIDFFNRELTRFLSFNNTILASIEDAIIVCDTRR
jgi:hypothetical protein